MFRVHVLTTFTVIFDSDVIDHYLFDVLHTLCYVSLFLCIFCVIGVDENRRMSIKSKFNHLTAQLGEMGETPQQLQDLETDTVIKLLLGSCMYKNGVYPQLVYL